MSLTDARNKEDYIENISQIEHHLPSVSKMKTKVCPSPIERRMSEIGLRFPFFSN